MDLIIRLSKLLVILLIAFQSTAGSKVAGPSLNIPSEFVLYSSPASLIPLEITCSGLKSLRWETKVGDEVINITENYVPVGYSSTLTIAEPYPEDTGNFTCRYDTGESATTYVYVFDNHTAFVNPTPHGTLKVNIGADIVLDCRTTHPSISVRVMKINSEDVTDKFVYDRRWYIFRKKAESIKENGLYACKAKGFQNDNTWLVDIRRTIIRHKPSIDYYYNSHFVVGNSFQLNCSIPVAENGNESPSFKWKTPSGRMHEIVDTKRGNSVVSSLKVSSAQMVDDGDYTCIVTYGSDEISAMLSINITDSVEPFVRFDKKDQGALSVMEHELFQWILYFRAFPNNVSYTFYNHLNKTLTDDMHEVTTDFNYNEGKVSLRINNIGAEDFGRYSAALSVDGTVDKSTVIVVVNATPKIEFTNFPGYFDINNPISLRSNVLSFDGPMKEPNVTWWFNDKCPAGYGSCEDPKNGIQLANGSITKQNMYNKYEAQMTFNASSSGVIESRVENKFGVNFTKSYVVLSDIGGTFVFKATVQSVDQRINKSLSMSIVEGDHIIITCAALDFVYEGLSFNTKVDSGSLISDCRTNLSSGSCLDMTASMEMEGSYECRAKNRKSGKMEVATLSINVTKEQMPSILKKSNVTLEGTSATVKLLKPFHIYCYIAGMPTPTITWFKDGENIDNIAELANDFGQTIFLRDNDQILEFKVAQKIYSGTYVCRVKNRAGTIEPSIAIEVENAGLSALHWSIIIMALVFITLLCSTIMYLWYRVKRERKFRRELHLNKMYLFEKGNIGNLNPDCTVDEQAVLLPYDKRFEVAKERIKFGKLLGSGAFGRVMEAKVDGLEVEGITTRVAAKMCKDGADATQLHALTLELKIMVHIGKHLNIVNLMGANTTNLDKGELWILVEYCRYGNLLKFIQKYKSRFVNQIDQETGMIDPDRRSNLFHDMRSPTSIGRSSYGFSAAIPTDAAGYLDPQGRFGSMKSSHFGVRHPSVSSNSGSVTGSSSRPGMYVGNPNYVTAAFSQQSSIESSKVVGTTPPNSAGPAPPPYVTAAQFAPNRSPSPKHTRADSTISSEDGYHKTLATDMTVLTSPTGFSPSSEPGDFSFDSHTISSEPGDIPGVNAPLTTSDLICWSWQVSNGMEYLSKRKVLHGDLAARNLLLAEQNVVKISDFGLSRDMYKNDVYMKQGDGNMPIKWMSPEAIQQKIFSTQSDVWAFGITMWELFTLGNTPYPGVPLDPNFTYSLENGMRNEKPKYATNELYQLMLNCWNGDPIERPNFYQISEILSEMISPDNREDYVAMNDVYKIKNEEWMGSREDYFKLMTSPDFVNFQQSQVDYGGGVDGGSYIPMSEFKTSPESEEERASELNPPGYLDMRSVRSSPPNSASLFSPRPSQPSGNIFDFSGTGIANTTEQTSPAETSKLLNKSEDIKDGSTHPVETEMLILNNAPLTPTSNQLVNNNNQLDSNQHEYNNIDNMVPKNNKKQLDENSIAYVNLSKMSENPAITPGSNDSNYINTCLV